MEYQPIEAQVLRCWGKTSSDRASSARFHPAIYHMLDVANVAEVLLVQASPRWKTVLGRVFQCDAGEVHTWLPWIAALHDLGKISAAFQGMRQAGQSERLLAEGFFPADMDIPHSLMGRISFQFETHLPTSLPPRLSAVIQEMISSHHGRFDRPGNLRRLFQRTQRDEHPSWLNYRAAALDLLTRELLPDGWPVFPSPPNLSSAIMALTGFTILCDWLGSDSTNFPAAEHLPLEEYRLESRKRAYQAVSTAGFLQPGFSQAYISFRDLFENITAPRPLQLAVDTIPEEILAHPCLAVIEAPTGEGKTEAALALAHRIAAQQGTDELYYALPTAATSNQMFDRVNEYIHTNLGLDHQAKLVHSQAFLLKDQVELRPLSNGNNDSLNSQVQDWFSPKKRALLASFGVGTIDQAELGALNVAHNALRLAGLAGKTVILDEVHAYDAYMTTIIERLLEWLSAMGTSVILLSATLPRSRRAALARAYGCAPLDDQHPQSDYPRLWIGNQDTSITRYPSAAQKERKIMVRPLQLAGNSPAEKATWLLDQVQEGGCLCWITNTVARAQTLFEELLKQAVDDIDLLLLHSRFSVSEREQREKLLIQRFGPNGQRPKKAIVVGTQVLEQSLDLDFDLMVSDLAPVDLLLQRAGRLHRHLWRTAFERGRRDHPVLWVYCDRHSDSSLDISIDEYIYSRYLLLRTDQVLPKNQTISLPSAYRDLIENVYNLPPDGASSELLDAWKEMENEIECDRQEAENHLLRAPHPDVPFCDALQFTFDEDEDRAGWMVGRTRKGEESITLLPLETSSDQVFCIGVDEPLDLKSPASRELELKLLRSAVKLSGNRMTFALREAAGERPPMFDPSGLLKTVCPLWLQDGRASLSTGHKTLQLELHPLLGLRILPAERKSS